MDLLKKKHDGQVIRWEPFATSTPLKPISKPNPKVKNATSPLRTTVVPDKTRKELDVSKIFQNKQSVKSKIKRNGKNRSKAYFDLSSSSEDDNYSVENKRPVIKIGTESTDKIRFFAEKAKYNVEIKDMQNSSTIQRKLGNRKCQNITSKTQQEPDNKEENRSATSNSDLENVDVSAINQIRVLNTINSLRPENNQLLYTNSKVLQSSKNKEKPHNKVTGRKQVLAISYENHGNIDDTQRLLKRKDTKNQNPGYVKKRRQLQTVSTKNKHILKTSEKGINSSHQLFTDTTQEELINTLCLTGLDQEESIKNVDSQKTSQKSIPKLRKNETVKPKSSKEDRVAELMGRATEKQGRPKRTRQAPKQYWLIEDKSKPLKDKTKGIPKKKPFVLPASIEKLNQTLDAVDSKTSACIQILSENKEVSVCENNAIGCSQIKKVKKPDAMCGMKEQLGLGTKNNKVPSAATKPESTCEHLVFLPLNEISYLENEFGHQVSQICSMKKFKCGIFKLKPHSNFTWGKSGRSNYMGGVLVKGEMTMRIGNKEHILHEGDMVLVPPSKECQASNTRKCESIFYYWCKSFNK